MNISVFGLGYVGCVSLGCLAQGGHNVVGVDVNQTKVDLINGGKPTIVEKSIAEIIAREYEKGRIRATCDYKEALLTTDISIICVGTPSTEEGHLNSAHILDVAEQIGVSLGDKNSFHVIVIRSTVPPGTNHRFGKVVERASNKKRNVDFSVVSNPEFMREGSAVDDYYNPAVIVIGSGSKKALDIVKMIYRGIDAPVIETDIEVAEIIKHVNNSFHALKISFANEIGNICKKVGIDSRKVMNLFCQDAKLNIAPSYFKPGFAYGGSCLPKDLKALKTLAHDNYVSSPVIEAIERSNENQKEIALKIVTSKDKKRIGVIGLSFKVGTDDLRYSPTVELVEKLLGKGYEIRIYDENVYLSQLIGANKEYIEKHIPHIAQLISDDLGKVIANSQVLVITHDCAQLGELLKHYPEKIVVDLVGVTNQISNPDYEGICW